VRQSLRRDLAGGRQDERASAASGAAVQTLEHRDEESQGLAAAGLGGGDDVATGEGERDDLPLYRSRFGEVQPANRRQEVRGDSEFVENRVRLTY
jgi:hypothetical protein